MDDGAPPLPPRNAVSSDNLAPPPLPARQSSSRPRSTSDTTERVSPFSHNDDSPDALATAYLQRHVREMKRTSVAGLAKPIRQNYQVRNDDDVIETNWKEYFEAWIQYIINSFASGQVDDKLEPFSLKVVKSGVDRLYGMAAPLKAPAMTVRRVYRWENRWLTGPIALAYLILWYHDFLVPFGFAVCIGYIISIRLDLLAQFGVEALATAADEEQPQEQQESKHTKQFWKRLKRDLGSSDLNYGFPALETKSMNEWRSDIQRKYGPSGQLLFMDMLDRLERVKNLLTWKRPEKTRMLLWLLSGLALVLTFLPTRYMTKMVFLWLGIEFFVLQSLRSHYPRYRRLFNILDWLLWGVPNDAEYAMEVIRLHRQTEDLVPKEPKNRPWRRSQDLDRVSEEDEKEMKPAATSTAATLAIMVASAAAGQIKHVMDEQFERARLQDAKAHEESDSSDGGQSTALKTSGSSNSLFERKTSRGTKADEESEVHETYGCIYKNNIPGRILLTTNGLQFRTSRVTGAKILVYYYWQDIVSVRKSKSINVFIWHTNGLDITTVDGEELHFDNVIKRDDCFNKLVAAAGDSHPNTSRLSIRYYNSSRRRDNKLLKYACQVDGREAMSFKRPSTDASAPWMKIPQLHIFARQFFIDTKAAAWSFFSLLSMNASRIKHDYRALLKAGYAAVQHERHAKLQIRQRIRNRFETFSNVNEKQVQNTLQFLMTASKQRGYEHSIVRNICELDKCRAKYAIIPPMHRRKFPEDVCALHNNSYDELDLLIKMLNTELQLCL